MRSGVERGAEPNVHKSDTQSCGELFLGPVSVKIEPGERVSECIGMFEGVMLVLKSMRSRVLPYK